VSHDDGACANNSPVADAAPWDDRCPDTNQGAFTNMDMAPKMSTWSHLGVGTDIVVMVNTAASIEDDIIIYNRA